MENQEMETAAKKAHIAQIKLIEIIGGAVNCQPRPSGLEHLTQKGEMTDATK